MKFTYLKKLSRGYGRYRIVRKALYIVMFFLIISAMAFNMVLSSMMNPEGLAYDICRFDAGDNEEQIKSPVKYQFTGYETHFDDTLGLSIEIVFSSGFITVVPAFSVTGISENITKFRDFQIISGEKRANGIYITESMWNKIKKTYPFIKIGEYVKLRFKELGVNVTGEYPIAGIIRDRWIFYYLYHTREEILVPITFFSDIPQMTTIHEFNQTVYWKYRVVRIPEKYVPLTSDAGLLGTSYYGVSHEHVNEYRSFLFIMENLLLLFLLIGGGIALYVTVINTEKYAPEIGILRALGVAPYKIITFLTGENLYTMLSAYLWAMILAVPFSVGILFAMLSMSVFSALIYLVLVPLLMVLMMLLPSVIYLTAYIKSEKSIFKLRNL